MGGRGRSRGATLLELIAVIVLLAIAVPALLVWVTTSLRGAGLESESVRVAQLGQQRLEVLLVAKRDGRLDFSDADALQQSCEEALDTFDSALNNPPPDGYTVSDPTCVLANEQRGELQVTVSGPQASRRYNLEVYDLE